MKNGRVGGCGVVIFDHLERRELFAALVTDIRVLPNPMTLHQQAVVEVGAVAGFGAPVVSIFRDVNGNGLWNVGVDEALGDIPLASVGGKFRRFITPRPEWGNTVRIFANARDIFGDWSSQPRGTTVTVQEAPVITHAELSTNSVERGTSMNVTIDATDDRAVQAASAFLDQNGNARWDNGTDIALGNDFTRDSVTGRFQITFAITQAMGWQGSVYVDVVDNNNSWAGQPRLAGVFSVTSGPTLSNLAYSVLMNDATTLEQTFVFSVNAADDVAVTAVTFFIDHDRNGRWTPGTDASLGTTRTPTSGSRFEVMTTTYMLEAASIPIIADAMDDRGVWSPVRPTVNAVPILPAQITTFVVDDVNSMRASWEVQQRGEQAPISGGIRTSIELFADTNQNDLIDPADTLIWSSPLGQSARRIALTLTADHLRMVPSTPFNWISRSVHQLNGGAPFHGATRIGHRFNMVNVGPVVRSIAVSTPGFASTLNTPWTVTVDGTSGSASFGAPYWLYYDNNNNGRFDTGMDVDLGSQISTEFNDTKVWNGTFTANMRRGGSFTAQVYGTTGLSGEVIWSWPTSARRELVIERPTAVLAGAPVAIGNTIQFEVDATDIARIQSLVGWIDDDGDNLRDAGELQITGLRISGTPQAGRWRMSFELRTPPIGTFRLAWQATSYGSALGQGFVTSAVGSTTVSF